MINAAAEIGRWVSGISADNAFALYALPVFIGLRNGTRTRFPVTKEANP